MLSSHHYKSFKISMIHKLRFTTDVQLGNRSPQRVPVGRSRSQRVPDSGPESKLGLFHLVKRLSFPRCCYAGLLFGCCLGISGEKLEIDPVTNQKASTKFWIRQKPISIDSDHLCACDLVEERSPSEWVFAAVARRFFISVT